MNGLGRGQAGSRACPRCGAKLRAGARFCGGCGAAIVEAEPVEPPPAHTIVAGPHVQSPSPGGPPVPSMPAPSAGRCARCGHTSPADSRFCRSCGAPLASAADGESSVSAAAVAAPTGVGSPRDVEPATQPMSGVAAAPGSAMSAPLGAGPAGPGASDPAPPGPLGRAPGPAPSASPEPARSAASRRTGLIAFAAVLAAAAVAAAVILVLQNGSAQQNGQGGHGKAAHGEEATAAKRGATSYQTTSKPPAGAQAQSSIVKSTPIEASSERHPSHSTGTESRATHGGQSMARSASGSPGPSDTIRRHLEDLGDGEYEEAFGLMTPTYRGENPQWPTIREEADPAVRVLKVDSPSVSGSDAYVFVDFFAQDSKPTPGSDTDCREFRGTIELVQLSAGWRYEPTGDDLKSSLQPNPDCEG